MTHDSCEGDEMARVCVIVYTDYPADTRVRRAAEALADRGDDVTVLCPQTPSLQGRSYLSGVRLCPIRSVGYTSAKNPLAYILLYLRFVIAVGIRALRLHLRRRFDLVHVHTMPDFLVFSALGLRLLGAKVILDVHDLMPELYASKFDLPESHSIVRGLKWVERVSVRFADAAVAVHKPHLDALVAHGNPRDKFTIVMNLPDPRMFRRRNGGQQASEFTVIYHGMVGMRNGLDVAVRAAGLAHDEVPGLKLRIIGDGDDFPRVERLVDELGVAETVHLEQGFRPIEDVIPLLEQASVGVVPIVDDPFTKYMLPVKLLEYVALGMPVIASRTETIRAHFSDDMLAFIPPGDADALAARIVELYRDPSRRTQLAAEADRFTDEHNWPRERKKYYQLVDSMVTS
jgi:glycosyltransferase involved in cell wall biosynthesis